MSLQRSHRLVAEAGKQLPAQLRTHLDGEVASQLGDVLRPLHQRRQVDYVETEPVQQVGAKFPGSGQGLQVRIGGSDHPHIHLQGLLATQALEFPVFYQPQQLLLQPQGHGAQLVQEQGATIRAFKAALANPGRASEGAGLVTEQLRFQQRIRQRGAVDLDERGFPARRQEVQALRRQLFTRASSSQDKYRTVDTGQP